MWLSSSLVTANHCIDQRLAGVAEAHQRNYHLQDRDHSTPSGHVADQALAGQQSPDARHKGQKTTASSCHVFLVEVWMNVSHGNGDKLASIFLSKIESTTVDGWTRFSSV